MTAEQRKWHRRFIAYREHAALTEDGRGAYWLEAAERAWAKYMALTLKLVTCEALNDAA